MNIFFDLDYTLQAADGTLRPLVREVFQRLREGGHALFIWSGVGLRWPEVRRHGLAPLVDGVLVKPLSNHHQAVRALPVPLHLAVDDHWELVRALGGILVRPYFFSDPRDREMERVYRIVVELCREGRTADPAFHPGPFAPGQDGDAHPPAPA